MSYKTKQLILDYQATFGPDHGKRVVDDLQTWSNYTSTFENLVGYAPPEKTAFELGKREAFLYILDKIRADPNQEMQEVAETEVPIAVD